MTPYQYLNTNNNQTADLSYNEKAKAYIDSLLANPTITHSYFNPAYSRDEDGNLTQNQRTNENGQLLYQVGSGDDISYVTDPTDRTYLNGYEVSPAGENRYSVGIDDPTSKGYFNINAQIDPTTNKLSGLGSTYGSHGHFDYLQPAMFAALVGGGLLAAPYLGGAALFGEGAAAGGGALAGEGALTGGGAVGGGVDVANGYYGLGSGTSLSADAAVNPLNPFYGTANPAAQANLVGSNLIAGGADANLALLGGNPLLPVSGAGLGGGLSASSLSGSDIASNLSKLSKLKGGTTQKQLANALRLPTDLNTNVAVYKQENPFYYSPQQQLANMLKV